MTTRTSDPVAYPPELEAAEASLIRERRKALTRSSSTPAPETSVTATATPKTQLPDAAIGFGLSGGGIRSATFCLGVFQAIARHGRLREIDYLSTVSGGGYFGSFLGRLFTRDWIRGVGDVEHVLQAVDPPNAPPAHAGWGARTFHWLRENGRYLAPRGSGDLLVLGAILMRNWIAVQIVMITTMLTLFVALQILRVQLEIALGMNHPSSVVGNLLCNLPGGATLFWWSPWIVLLAPILVLLAIPAGWAYWLVIRRPDGKVGVSPAIGVIVAGLIGVAGVIWYRPPQFILPLELSQAPRFWASAILALATLLVLAYWQIGEYLVKGKGSSAETGHLLRNWLTRNLKKSLLWSGLVLAWTLIDSAGGTIYAAASTAALTQWGASLLAAFAGIGAFAQQVSVLFRSTRRQARSGVSLAVFSWIGALVVLAVWLVAINVASQAVAWNFQVATGRPVHLTDEPSKTILGADHVDVTRTDQGFVVTAASRAEAVCMAPPVVRPAPPFSIAVFIVLLVFTVLFGRTRTFANMSSIHSFYTARLTRTFLGASNSERFKDPTIGVTDNIRGDDYSSTEYWNWPWVFSPPSAPSTHVSFGSKLGAWLRRIKEKFRRASNFDSSIGWTVRKPWAKGAPLHLINVTVNETVDARTKVQNQDRKGTGLAIGPCGLSLGIRHHLVQPRAGSAVVRPSKESGAYRVFRLGDEGAKTPDPLSLGRWVSVSGAAFSAAAGANTSVSVAILAGMFNVRLGYWWNSGTSPWNRPSPWLVFERMLPVQAMLLSEAFARTLGTAGRLWNLSDGGHFENMGGYELIRRRLPVIVIVDAEADPDYSFQGLSDLVRKARLDFDAEIIFLNDTQLSDTVQLSDGLSVPVIPESMRPYFGSLDALRRGRWSDEPIPTPDGSSRKRYTIEVSRERTSRAHAALARVMYSNGDKSWLVYVKATLMGDEPEDVCHYHRAHPEFPQETTIDQFFDEAQWESYRRLGLHIGHRVLTPELFDHVRMLAGSL